jgi:hypothetical protein
MMCTDKGRAERHSVVSAPGNYVVHHLSVHKCRQLGPSFDASWKFVLVGAVFDVSRQFVLVGPGLMSHCS